MTDLLELFANLEQAEGPVVLATPLALDGPGLPPGGWFILAAAAAIPALGAEVQAVLAAGGTRQATLELGPALPLPALAGRTGTATLLLERIVPGKLPPWLHFCAQQLKRGSSCVLATVAAVAGGLPYAVGERFSYDERSHGMLPMDGRFSLELQRACLRARAAGQPIRERFSFPSGALELNLELLGAQAQGPRP
jgi:hypothetical protein